MLCAWDDVLELGDHLATVADAERKAVFACKEGGEHCLELRVVEDALRPTGTCTEDVAVREAAASDDACEVGEVNCAAEEVGHVDVDCFEACAVEGEGHFVLAVDALLAENGDFRALGGRLRRGVPT